MDWYDRDWYVSAVDDRDYITKYHTRDIRQVTVMPTYCRVCRVSLLMHLLIFHITRVQFVSSFSILISAKDAAVLARRAASTNIPESVFNCRKLWKNIAFSLNLSFYFTTSLRSAWLSVLLLSLSGNVHPNPGPLSETSSSSSSDSNLSTSILKTLNINHHLSFVHYNVQSILTKLDILHAELFEFDFLAFSETWLSSITPDGDLILLSCNNERRDRVGDRYGGLIIYIKEGLHYRRREDVEPVHTECMWIELPKSEACIVRSFL